MELGGGGGGGARVLALFAELFLPHSGAQWLGLMPGEGNKDENYVHINLVTIGVFDKLDDCSNANMGSQPISTFLAPVQMLPHVDGA